MLALRRNSPRLRYWLWLAASVKFLIPFSLLVSTGARVQMPPDTPSLHAVTVQQISTYFAPALPVHTRFHWEWIAVAIWAAGRLFLMFGGSATGARRRLRCSNLECSAFFILSWCYPKVSPISLTEEQLQAVLAHEARHIDCHDNLTAALHMIVETLFWFHPLVWWIGARLMDERERDCDEAVLRQGSQPGVYARSIVQVCETYVETPLACASGISGSDLKKRIREIMTWCGSLPVTLRAKALLAVATLAAVSIPFVIGILRAQTLPPAPTLTYDAVAIHKTASGTTSIRFSPGPEGGLRTLNTSAVKLVAWAYQVEEYQILDAPGWASSQGYDVTFTPDKSEAAFSDSPTLKQLEGWQRHTAQRTQAVLRDRFGLVLRSETRELPIFNLTQAKGGHKLALHPGEGGVSLGSNGHQIMGNGVTIGMLAVHLSTLLGRPVRDETHLNGELIQSDARLGRTDERVTVYRAP